MKNIFLLLSFLFCVNIAFAQTPSHFKYQGVARDANNQAFANTALGLKVSIVLDSGAGSGSGLVRYSEKHLAFTSPVGVFSFNIGDGETTFGDIEEINWRSGDYWLKIEMDINGGDDYVYMGASPILPVPLAVHALTVADKDDADADPNNEIQTLQFNANNNTLSLTNGGQVDLSSLVGGGGGTDDQTLQLNGTTLSIEGGNQVNLAAIQDGTEDADADPANELQTISFNVNTNQLTISEGNTINIPAGQADADADPQNEIQTLQLSGLNLSIEGGNQVNLAAVQDGTEDADADPENEIQTLQFDANSNTLSLSDGGQVDLSSLEGGGGGTDDQTLQLNGTILEIEGGNQVNLATLQDGTEDADADPQNEIQTLQLSGLNLSIEGGNQVNLAAIQDGTEDADANPTNELQTLFFDASTNELSLSSGNTVNLPIDVDDNDQSPFNELQTLSLDGNTLELSQGGQVDLSGLGGGSSLWLQGLGNDLYTQEDVAIGFAASTLSTLEVKEDITIRKANGAAGVDLFTSSTGGHVYLYKAVTGGQNSTVVNIDAANNGGNINLRNTNGSIRGEWQVNNSNSHLSLTPPDLDLGIELSTSNTSANISLGMPNGSEGVQIGASIFGGSARFSGSTGSDIAFIGRNSGSPGTGMLSIGNGSNSEMIEMYVSSSDGSGTRAGWIDGYTSGGNQIYRLGSFTDVSSRGYLGIFDDNGNEAVSVRGSRGGEVILRGSISKNVVIGTTTNSTDLGRISVYDALDDESAGFYTDFAGNGIVFADIKNFRMDHPSDDSKEIWYACVEGPEAAAYERGTAELVNGESVINFPEHFALVANHETMTVMITPLSADCKGLAVVEKTATGFKVKELFQGTGTYAFDWEVKCVRKGYENYEPIREKKDRQ